MNVDFALILIVLIALSGMVWLIDALFLVGVRRRRGQVIERMTMLSVEERQARSRDLVRQSGVVGYARSFLPVLLLVLGFRTCLAEPFKIPSGSMMPTLLVGDFILVNKFAYGLRLPVVNTKVLDVGEPKRGDVFVFRHPDKPNKNYIKRVIGLPGDEISYHDKTLSVNGSEIAETELGAYIGAQEPGRRMGGALLKQENLDGVEHRILQLPQEWIGHEGTWTVPPGQYFAMGDNRDNSEDSRFWGFVPEENLVGKAFLVWMNFGDLSRVGTMIR